MPPPLLYRNDSASIWAIDIPTSIAWAQGFPRTLRSVRPPEEPFHNTEPKGEKRTRLLACMPAHQRQHDEVLASLALNSLAEATQCHADRLWCLPRTHLIEDPKLVDFDTVPAGGEQRDSSLWPPLILSADPTTVNDSQAVTNGVVHNPYNVASTITIVNVGRFWIPARSTFICSSIDHGASAFGAARSVPAFCNREAPESPITFDMVLLDPPWANRSVRRSQAYSSTERQTCDPFVQVLPFLQASLTSNGYVAIWITNKMSIREQVIQALGELTLQLHEEWVWLKITKNGQPVLPIDGIWRKPYEILLLFSRQPSTSEVTKRTILAVPDVHSRKPNPKVILEQVLPLPRPYNALEIFARNLTSGWWSWGNEVLKFQHESHWESSETDGLT